MLATNTPPVQTTLSNANFHKWRTVFVTTTQFGFGTISYALADGNSIADISPHPGKEPDKDDRFISKTGKPLGLIYAREPPLLDDDGSDSGIKARQKTKYSIEEQLEFDLTATASTALHRAQQIHDKKQDKHEKEWAIQHKDDSALCARLLASISPATLAQAQLHPDWKLKVAKPRKSGSPCTLTHDVMNILNNMYARGSVAGVAENLQALADFKHSPADTSIYQTVEHLEKLCDQAFDPLDPAKTGAVAIEDLKTVHLIVKLSAIDMPAVRAALHRVLKMNPDPTSDSDTIRLRVPPLIVVKSILTEEIEVHAATSQPPHEHPAGFAAAIVVPKTAKPPRPDYKKPNPDKVKGSHCSNCFDLIQCYFYHTANQCKRTPETNSKRPPTTATGGATSTIGLLAASTTAPTTTTSAIHNEQQRAIAEAVALATTAHAAEIAQLQGRADKATSSLHALIANVTNRD